MKKYSELKAPKPESNDEFDNEMMADLDLDTDELDEGGESALAAISDDELLAELKARGLSEADSEMPEGEEDLDLESDLDDDDILA